MAWHPVVHKIDELPKGWELGGVKPRIKNRGDLSVALAEIAWIDSREETVQARLKQLTNLISEQAKADLQMPIGKKIVPFADRRAALKEAVAEFVLEHREDVFRDGTKTAKFPSGSVALRDNPPAVVFDDDVTPKSIVDRLVGENGLVHRAIEWLKRQGVLPFLKVKFELDTTGIKRALEAGQVSPAQLAELGMRVEGETRVVISPREWDAAADGPAVDARDARLWKTPA